MAKLEHVNLVVSELEPTLAFFLTAFPHWKVRGQGEMTWYGKPRKWLHVGDQETYITLNDDGEGENRDLSGHQPGLSHIGFSVDNMDEIIQRLQDNGYQIDVSGQDHPYRKNVYFKDPAGFQVEFVEYLSNKDSERNAYSLA